MYREIVILLSSPQYFFPLFALVSLSRPSFVRYFLSETRAIRVAASTALTNELAIVVTSFFLFAVERTA